MSIIVDKRDCCGCHACYNICPTKAIRMEADEEGFLYPQVDEAKCISCDLCRKVCACQSSNGKKQDMKLAYAAYCKDEQVRELSSSGGIFTLLAGAVIRQGGSVFGAAFDEKFQVQHISVRTLEELDKLRGSKYVQSRIGNTFLEAKSLLDMGQLVLFTGTPCQISGLHRYLKKDYSNLITQDIICHGVPSPMVWKKYVDYREARAASGVQKISFREKRVSWKKYSMLFTYKNGTEYLIEHSKDYMMRAFLKDLCLRPSCYSCKCKCEERESDITLADFWGIWEVLPEMDDDRGTSLVIIHSEKGANIFKLLREQMVCRTVDLEESVRFNMSMTKAAKCPPSRHQFMKDIELHDFGKVVNEYCSEPIVKKILTKIRSLSGRVIKLLYGGN